MFYWIVSQDGWNSSLAEKGKVYQGVEKLLSVALLR